MSRPSWWPRHPAAQLAAAVAGVLVVLNVVALAADAVTPSPSGPRSSSFATSPQGLAAWADLARAGGVPVRAIRATPTERSLPASGTVVLLDPGIVLPAEARALRRFARRGGTVIAGGRRPGAWIGHLLGRPDDPPRWARGGDRDVRPLAPVGPTRGVRTVRTAGEGHWEALGPALPLLAAGGRAPLAYEPAGAGRVILVADPSPLQNRLLDQADNAALALALAGEGPLAFVEGVHGYGRGRGLGALPANARWALWLLLAAALALMLSRGRRLGPPEAARRDLPPPRAAYVDAMAATLARGRRPPPPTPNPSEDP